MFFLEKIKIELAKDVNKVLGGEHVVPQNFEYPPENAKGGDLALPVFKLAKELKTEPRDIAGSLRKACGKQKLVERAEAKGGYINFYLNREKAGKEIMDELRSQGLENNYAGIGKGEKIAIEYISPNSNKPLHLGHIRNAYLGSALANILEFCGYKVQRTCLVNDRGIAISKAMLAYKLWGKGDTPRKSGLKSDHFVGKYYVLFEKKAKTDPSLQEKAQKLLQKWEGGDAETLALWKKMQTWALSGYKETYKRLGVRFDKVSFESKLYKRGKELAEKYYKEKKFSRDEKGNIVAKLGKCGMPDKVMLRADGTAVYSTTDMVLAYDRIKEGFGKIFYVVGSEQDLYFKQLFCILNNLKFDAEQLRHISYGLVELPEGRMKSREGTVVDADDLLDKMEEIAKNEIKARHDFIREGEAEKRARVIAESALRFYILNVNPPVKIKFNPKESLSFTGKTGPYILYSYARLHSIWRKGRSRGAYEDLNFSFLENKMLWKLVLEIGKFPEVILSAINGMDPEEMAAYLYNLSTAISDFYHNVRVLEAELQARRFSVAVIGCLLDVICKGTALLGMETLEEM